MRATFDRESLLAAFGTAAGVAPSRSPKPILQSVLLDCRDGGATLSATDLEVGVVLAVAGARVDAPGRAMLPAGRFGAILRTSADDEVGVEVDGDTLVVTGGRSRFVLPSEDPDLFPAVPEFTGETWYTVRAGDLKRALRRTAFATDPESTRYALGGILVEPNLEALDFVATDGRRLAVQRVTPGGPGPEITSKPVIPLRAAKLLDRALDDDDAPVDVSFAGRNAASFRTGEVLVSSRLVEGRFPRYQDVFPADPGVKVPLEVGAFRMAVEQASVVTSTESRGLDFRFAGGVLAMTAQAADAGKSAVELPVDYDGPPLEVTFDGRYLLDALKALDPASGVTAELIDGKSPAVFRSGDGFTYVLMPLTKDR